MKTKPIYLFSHEITYKRFYNVWKEFPQGDIVPVSLIKGKPIWEMIRDKQIFVYIDETKKEDPIIFATKLPKRTIYFLK